jgi:hypothetical protein
MEHWETRRELKMAYTLSTEDPHKELSSKLESFWICYSFSVNAANSELTVNRGYFAALLSDEGPPRGVVLPGWGAATYKIDGGEGVGSITLSHVVPERRQTVEVVNEFGQLYLFRLDINQPVRAWVNTANWNPTFQEPLASLADRTRYLSHKLTAGEVNARWVHRVVLGEANGVNTALTLVLPFLSGSAFSDLLARHTIAAGQQGYMPVIELTTQYGKGAEHKWKHFGGPKVGLPGDVQGCAMIAAGVLQTPLFEPSPHEWLGLVNADPNVDTAALAKLYKELASIVSAHPFRTEATRAVDNAVVRPPSIGQDRLEMLYLTGNLGNQPVFAPQNEDD